MTTPGAVLSLYDFSGAWSRPFSEAGSRIVRVDLGLPRGVSRIPGQILVGADMASPGAAERLGRLLGPGSIDGVLAAPPCDCFTRASAWLWGQMDASGRTETNLQLVDAVLEIVRLIEPRWWAMENPPGRLRRRDGTGLRPNLGEPRLKFHPWHYGAWAPDDPSSRRTKQTYVWGNFGIPVQAPHPNGPEPYPAHLPPQRRDPIRQMGSRNKRERERTPPGFAIAFARAQLEIP